IKGRIAILPLPFIILWAPSRKVSAGTADLSLCLFYLTEKYGINNGFYFEIKAMRILQEALTFDDVLLVPAFSQILPKNVDLTTALTREIRLNVPLVSSAMDTVTEAQLAIALAQEGGIGILHKSMSIEKQAQQVRVVKKFESGVVKDPITV